MKNSFSKEMHRKIEKETQNLLSTHPGFLSQQTRESPRAVGDAIQTILEKNSQKIFSTVVGDTPHARGNATPPARRAMADLAFYDKDKNYCAVDVKTHRLDTTFNRSNLTSVERLSKFYEDDGNIFTILKIDYEVSNKTILIKHVTFRPIEFFSWNCLTVGALGWGQIQFVNANRIKIDEKQSRKKWMLEMCSNLFDFYPKEVAKIRERITYFQNVQKTWKHKTSFPHTIPS